MSGTASGPLGAASGGRAHRIVVAMDWTDFDADGQATLMLSLVTGHGRATPLVWLTVERATLKNQRNDYEDRLLGRLAELLPAGVPVTDPGRPRLRRPEAVRVADRRTELRLRHPLPRQHPRHRCRRRDASRRRTGSDRPAGPASLRGAEVTRRALSGRRRGLCARQGHEGALVPGRQRRRCRPPGADRPTTPSAGRIEPSFRDTKDLRFGMGMGSIRISTPERRDRLLLINAFAMALLTLLGAAGEALGMTGCSSPTPPSAAPTRCSAKAACSTNSSPPCRTSAAPADGTIRHPPARAPSLRRSLRYNLKMRGFMRR